MEKIYKVLIIGDQGLKYIKLNFRCWQIFSAIKIYNK